MSSRENHSRILLLIEYDGVPLKNFFPKINLRNRDEIIFMGKIRKLIRSKETNHKMNVITNDRF